MLSKLIDSLLGKLGARPDSAVEEHVVRGIRVVVENTRPDIATPDVLTRLDEALALVERHQPWRLNHFAATSTRFASRGSRAAARSSPAGACASPS